MAQKMVNCHRAERITRATADPKTYFEEARQRARREVAAEMAQERRRRRRRTPVKK